LSNGCSILKRDETDYNARTEEKRSMKKKYRCMVCSHVYDPAIGDPDSGIPAGTAFEDLPADWNCPECGASKADFEPMDD
jgi:rubredoxin